MAGHPKLEDEVKQNYEKQIDILSRICKVYEEDQGDDESFCSRKAEEICNLIMEFQSYGYPPDEIVGAMPPGWSIDQLSGVPRVDDISKAADACSLM